MRPSSTTPVSTPRTGRSPASSATDRAFSRACVRTRSTASTPCLACSSYRGGTTSNGMPSCSRIAIRRGDVDASRSGGAGGASATLACDPDLLAGPLPRPVGRNMHVVRVILRVDGRLKLDQSLDLEPRFTQEPNPVAVPQVELGADLALFLPVPAVQAELRPDEPLLHLPHVRSAQNHK